MTVKQTFFSLKGRISRFPFLIYGLLIYISFFLLFLAPILVIAEIKPDTFLSTFIWVIPIWLLQGILWNWVQLALCIKRFQDCNKSGWISIIPIFAGLMCWLFPISLIYTGTLSKDRNFDSTDPFIMAFAIAFTIFLISFSITITYLSIIKGTDGPNRYGPDPLASES